MEGPTAWSEQQLAQIDTAEELKIAVRRTDGSLQRWTPIWVVRAGDRTYARTWYQRETGWFGAALLSRRARIRVPGLESDVTVEPTLELRSEIDNAYRAKYGRYGVSSVGRMVTDEAAATTLLLRPAAAPG